MTAENTGETRTASRTQSHSILLIDDNPGDARLIREAFSAPLVEGLSVVRTGDEALAFVSQRGEYADAPQPDLILLDWHHPDVDDADILQELNGDPEFNHIPVIVLTGSQSERDVRSSYKQNANACIAKNVSPDELEATLRAFEDFWLSAARLPCADEEA